jgi:hypothetical protein
MMHGNMNLKKKFWCGIFVPQIRTLMSPIFMPPDFFLWGGGANEGYFLPAKVANNRTVSRIMGSADS